MKAVSDFHKRMDGLMSSAIKTAPFQPTCSKGCHACCYEAVYSTHAEVEHILEILTYPEKVELKKRLTEWIVKTEEIRKQDMPRAWDYLALHIPCPLLKDGLCSVYSRRPMSCREFLAIGPPADCEIAGRRRQKYFEFGEDGLGLYRLLGMPPIKLKRGKIVTDHLAALLAEELLDINVPSASRHETTPPPGLAVQ